MQYLKPFIPQGTLKVLKKLKSVLVAGDSAMVITCCVALGSVTRAIGSVE